MKIALYPGSFDPVTLGHLDVIERTAKIFNKVIVVVFRNSGKNPLFNTQERVDMLKEATAHLPGVEVDTSDGLTVHYAKARGAKVIIKGLRAISDFENEMKMAQMNHRLEPDIETMFIMTATQYAFLSSSIVREVACYGESVEGLVPPQVERRLKDKFNWIQGEGSL